MHRLDFPEQILRLALKIRGRCASGKTHFGFRETQLAGRMVRHAGEIQETDGYLPLIATWPGDVLQLERSLVAVVLVQAGGHGLAPVTLEGTVFQQRPWPHLADTTVGTVHAA